MLVQLEETERTFDLFWTHHSSRLRHCLALRQFEADFRELQAILDQHLKTIEEMTEVGETQARVEQLVCDTSAFQRICRVCTFIYTYIHAFLLHIKQTYILIYAKQQKYTSNKIELICLNKYIYKFGTIIFKNTSI